MNETIQTLLSLPPNLVGHFQQIAGKKAQPCFCTSDPIDKKLGSGGGTTHLLRSCWKEEAPETEFSSWLSQKRRILIHAGGQGRRIPAYAPSGKILTPIPVLRWERGQRLDQTLLDLQLPLYQRLMQKAPKEIHTLIASGDVLIRTNFNRSIPQADIVCFGLWEEPTLAQNHGVFLMKRSSPDRLDYMLQKPDPQILSSLLPTHFFLMDIGLWMLSNKAVERLSEVSTSPDGNIYEYDLYGQFGRALGEHPSEPDSRIKDLTVAIVPLTDGMFLHYGTSHELLSSTMTLMNLIKDQRLILQHGIKPHPSIFTQNSIIDSSERLHLPNVWIENSNISKDWTVASENILTGIPLNDWTVTLKKGQCIDIVPIGDKDYVLRPYGYNDAFKGDVTIPTTTFINKPMPEWMESHGVQPEDLCQKNDLQKARLFPVCHSLDELESFLKWFLSDKGDKEQASLWRQNNRLSAEDIAVKANLIRSQQQRLEFRKQNLMLIAQDYKKSVFYQLDLRATAHAFVEEKLPLPKPLPNEAPLMTRIHDAMFRAEYLRTNGDVDKTECEQAFTLLRQGLTEHIQEQKYQPQLNVLRDQIVWARSAVRVDLAGGWTDTPPYSLICGGSVVNMAILLNGQQPLQVYIRPNKDFNIVCRSIDLGTSETFSTFEELAHYNCVGSAFSIPKAALALAGFLPAFCSRPYVSLHDQLIDFGSGLDITLLSAIPAGSGLGTSSILAATVLGALSDFCGLSWNKNEISLRTLVLEQMLTTGGGWQDQFGGVLEGIKLLQTTPGMNQEPTISWLPNGLFSKDEYRPCHLLYYTGITRTAKNILAEIVRGMFLNSGPHLTLLGEMKQHAKLMSTAIQKGDFQEYGQLIRTTWEQNKLLDAGTCPPAVAELSKRIDDLALGYKLPGAGGGGYMYIVAKSAEAAGRIRSILTEHPLTPSARFVELSLSNQGLEISRS